MSIRLSLFIKNLNEKIPVYVQLFMERPSRLSCSGVGTLKIIWKE